MSTTIDGDFEICGFVISDTGKDFSPCICEDGHDGNHVVFTYDSSTGSRGGSLWIYEVLGPGAFKFIVHADMEPGPRPDDLEVAALYYMFTMNRQT